MVRQLFSQQGQKTFFHHHKISNTEHLSAYNSVQRDTPGALVVIIYKETVGRSDQQPIAKYTWFKQSFEI